MIYPPIVPLRRWRPRCCFSCGEPLEEPGREIQPRSIVACGLCARLYQAGDGAGELIAYIVGDQEGGVAAILRDFLAIHVEAAYRPPPPPAIPAAARQLQRRAA